ncbi:MAG: hypothetical protein CML68_09645 [Rhodobacteraceae bacterium]|nr:hypothetical protein [Paracoccaceae bacterium]
MALVVSVIGAGRIGRHVIDHVTDAPWLRPGRVLTRTEGPGAFWTTPADIIIDAAGPSALRAHGAACLARADLWTVSAAALVDDGFRQDLLDVARNAGTRLRLFAPWVAGIAEMPAGHATRLDLRISRPGSGAEFTGPLRAAARAFPDELNFAVAAALCGPGIEATRVEMTDAAPHRLEATLHAPEGSFRSEMTFSGQGTHPTALALMGALDRVQPGLGYGA